MYFMITCVEVLSKLSGSSDRCTCGPMSVVYRKLFLCFIGIGRSISYPKKILLDQQDQLFSKNSARPYQCKIRGVAAESGKQALSTDGSLQVGLLTKKLLHLPAYTFVGIHG